MTAGDIIDKAQEMLHDDGVIWTRSELLNWLNDGYQEMLAMSKACVRPFQRDLPGRTSYAFTFEWEDHFTNGLTRRFTRPIENTRLQATYEWETEFIAGITPTDSYSCVSQLWEIDYSDDANVHYRFALSRSHERPQRAYWNDRKLEPFSARELDKQGRAWWKVGGEPLVFMQGMGREQSFEVYQVQTDYNQSYDLIRYEQGCPRYISGERTYEIGTPRVNTWDYAYSNGGDTVINGLGMRFTFACDDGASFTTHEWEMDFINDATTTDTDSEADGIGTQPWENPYRELGLGLLRGIESNDRQYLACAYDSGDQMTGIIRYFGSGDNALTFWEVIIPHRQVSETDVPDLIPTQLFKYLRYFILAKAFDRPGQGYRPDLAAHWKAVYSLGVGLLASLSSLAMFDRDYTRDQVSEAAVLTPRRVRFPSTFERTPY